MPLSIITQDLKNLAPSIRKEFIPLECKPSICSECMHINTPCAATSTVKIYECTRSRVDILFVGQGAGKSEDINISPWNTNREPFVGKAGAYLRNLLMYIWSYEVPLNDGFNIALSNNVRCHPVDSFGKDRCPTKEEIDRCIWYLNRDIINLNPKAIITLGKSAALSFFPELESCSMAQLRSKLRDVTIVHENIVKNISVLSTYHPSFLCRQYGKFNSDNIRTYDQKVIDDVMNVVGKLNQL